MFMRREYRFIPRLFERRSLKFTSTSTSQLSLDLSHLRNVGIIAHIDAGKTTTTEYILYLAGKIKSIGKVDRGDTVTDFLEQEKERGITIQAAAVSFNWGPYRINLIDTPGHIDFSCEVEACTKAMDSCVLVVDAVSGVQAQTRSVWRRAVKRGLPAVAFVNKMDRDGADLGFAVLSIKQQLQCEPLILQLPISNSSGYTGESIDLLTGRIFTSGDLPLSNSSSKAATFSNIGIKIISESHPQYELYRQQRLELLESIAERDEIFLSSFIEAENPHAIPLQIILGGLRRVCLSRRALPVLCGAAIRGWGISALLDAMAALLPSPFDAPIPMLRRLDTSKKHSPLPTLSVTNSQLCALVFKCAQDPRKGASQTSLLVYARIFQGYIKGKDSIVVSGSRGTRGRSKGERVQAVHSVDAETFSVLPEGAGPGQVCVLTGLRNVRTGQTLFLEGSSLALSDCSLPDMDIAPPVCAVSIEPDKPSDWRILENALIAACARDPGLQAKISESNGAVLRGQGELHLEVTLEDIRRMNKIALQVGRTHIAYRETFDFDDEFTEILVEASYDRTINESHLAAGLTLRFTPLLHRDNSDTDNLDDSYAEEEESLSSRFSSVAISDEAKGHLSASEINELTDALRLALRRGPRGYPVVHVCVEVVAVKRFGISTSAGALRACAAQGVRNALLSKKAVLLEPISRVEVNCPNICVGSVLADLTGQRRAAHVEVLAKTTGQSNDHGSPDIENIIVAHIPVLGTLGYASALRSLTGGRASFSSEYLEHRPVDMEHVDLAGVY